MPNSNNLKNSEYQFQPEPGTLVIEDATLKHGFIQIPRLLLYARNVSRDAKILYAILLGYAWQEGECFPGYSRLCADMQASENMVRKYMRELEQVGIIEQKRRGLGKTNIYTIRDLRTSKIEVQEHNKTAVQEPKKSEGYIETDELETDLKLSNIRKAKPFFEKNEEPKSKPSAQPDASIPYKQSHTSPIPPTSPTPLRYQRKSQQEQRKSRTGLETVGSIIKRSRPQAAHRAYDEDRQVILEFIEDFAREFNDQAPLKSSTTRAYNLYQQSGLPIGSFISKMHEARSITKESTAQIRTQEKSGIKGTTTKKKMAYFFACLHDRLGLGGEEASHA